MNENLSHLPVAVAVSGGADSLHALMRLRESRVPAFALHGLFVPPDLLDDAEREGAEASRRRLAALCEEMDIPLHIVDLADDFLRAVIRPFVQSYADGLTPNPCALCNARIKFGLLLDRARSLGAGRLATGHYARLLPEAGGEHGPVLLQGADQSKDQSYFLSLVPRDNLKAALFPLGEAHKRDVLETLAGQNIVPPQPGESQEVCFIPGDDYRDFLFRAAGALGIALPGPGPMRLADGRRLGEHKGLWRYTEGQRRGLGLGWTEPLHVIAKRGGDNVLLVGPRREMLTGGCDCDDVNVLLPPEFWPETVLVKTRYRERPKAARARLHSEGPGGPVLRIRFAEPDAAVAPGQIAAVYVPFAEQENAPLRLAAGGVIRTVHPYGSGL